MKKKLLAIPMKGQYEQQCNAAALKEMGVPVIKSFKPGNAPKIIDWIEKGKVVEVDYPDITEVLINQIIGWHTESAEPKTPADGKEYTVKKFRNLLLRKIVAQF